MNDALINIESEGPAWLEWAAAMYESHHADHDPETPAGYAQAAMRRAEYIEDSMYDEVQYARYEAADGACWGL